MNERIPSKSSKSQCSLQAGSDITQVWRRLIVLLAWVALLALFFAQTEIQIEGSAGWGANLPTWRIEKHWLLDIFWGGRAMTGYHAWVFPFISLVFHFPFFFFHTWTLKLEARALASIMSFWIVEDFLWFVLNPAFGLAHFDPAYIPWHKHWFWFAPTDYWTFLTLACGLFWFSYSPYVFHKRSEEGN
ncbi:hypothetical protein [Undibacterium sp. RuTC16W]|uniref:hypothetical protein n=1 Tax=Undibacterium sp. RuTC16W TaxID=3413048 RepID=UPI003BF0ABBA